MPHVPKQKQTIPLGTLGLHFIILLSGNFLVIITSWFTSKNSGRIISKETYLVPPGGHISVKNMSSGSQVAQRYRTRAPPSPYTRRQECPKIIPTKKCLVPCQKARLCQGTFEKPRMMPSSCCPRHPPPCPPVFEPKNCEVVRIARGVRRRC